MCYKTVDFLDIMLPVITLTRRESFSSAHCLRNPSWTNEKNELVFGQCSRVHGHNYDVEVSIRGPVDADTGMVLDISTLKGYMKVAILDVFDHRRIDADVDGFTGPEGKLSTAENIAVAVWTRMTDVMGVGGHHHLLFRVKLWETPKNIVSYYGT